MRQLSKEELKPYLVPPEKSGLPVEEREKTKEEILQGIDEANKRAKEESNRIRARLRSRQWTYSNI